VWTGAAAVSLGGGIWSMHFVAMLAFKIPHYRMFYDTGLTLLSLAIAIVFTGVGFSIMNLRSRFNGRVLVAGLLMGSGVLAMHYIGMAAMRTSATINYQPAWVAISVVIAVVAAMAAVWLASNEQKVGQKIVAAALMGLAISGMHYAGMQAVVISMSADAPKGGGLLDVEATGLAVGVTLVTSFILLLALASAQLERLLQGSARREARIGLRLRMADLLRDGGTLQALEEVAALMGEHFGATRAGYGQLDPVEDGPAALKSVALALPDVVVMDFAMPGMNGAEVAREIRRGWPLLPIVFTSGYADIRVPSLYPIYLAMRTYCERNKSGT
jgi:NO-binding membrane sensor protein with MHYT domain/CheY-like chemotaxis protein